MIIRTRTQARITPSAARFCLHGAAWAVACLLVFASHALADTAASATAPQSGTRPIYVLPLGDSITQGGRNDRPEYTYRYPLYYMLKDAGYPVDFIGSLHAGLNADAVWPDKNGVPFDLDHEGHYGWTTSEVRDNLKGWMTTYPAAPDIVLIHLGSNDEHAWSYRRAIIRPLEDIIAMLREKNPHVVILIGHMIANGRNARASRPLLDELAQRISTADSPVVTVPHFIDWHERPGEPGSDTFDWAHPNPQGQQKMADKWFAAMKPFLDGLRK